MHFLNRQGQSDEKICQNWDTVAQVGRAFIREIATGYEFRQAGGLAQARLEELGQDTLHVTLLSIVVLNFSWFLG